MVDSSTTLIINSLTRHYRGELFGTFSDRVNALRLQLHFYSPTISSCVC